MMMMTELLLLATGGWLAYIGAASVTAAVVCVLLASVMTLALDALVPDAGVARHAPAYLGMALAGCWLGEAVLTFSQPSVLEVPLFSAGCGAAATLSFALVVQRWLRCDSQASW